MAGQRIEAWAPYGVRLPYLSLAGMVSPPISHKPHIGFTMPATFPKEEQHHEP